MKHPIILLQKTVWLIATLLISIWFSWHLLAHTNFLYGVWYDHGGIKENIQHYAPLNHYRQDFEHTTDAQRKALFAGIVTAIQHQGKGLNQLSYQNETGKIPLLRPTEITHLQDVANLITFLNKLLWGIFLLWTTLSIALLAKQQPFPTLKQASLSIGALTIGIASLLWLKGAEPLFYQLHRLIFPQNHPWFFYYQDSLMSTLMKAPDLFAYIAIALSLVAILIFSLIITIFNKRLATKP